MKIGYGSVAGKKAVTRFSRCRIGLRNDCGFDSCGASFCFYRVAGFYKKVQAGVISSLYLFYSNSIIVLNDLYTAVVTVEILGTSCYTGNSSKNLIEKYLKTM